MLFNSLDFAFFLPIVFCIYWFVLNKNIKHQNIFLIAASYFFYGLWDWRFLGLIAFSSFVDFYVGKTLKTEDNTVNRKRLLYLSLFVNLSLLGVLKYFNFFLDNFNEIFSFFGYKLDSFTLNIILPVGISFYTFQTLSYTIDVYKRKISATEDIVSFFAFVSFFPQLVAGPIERAKNLLPQFFAQRNFDYAQATDGLRQILWGLFKKVVVADNCAVYVNDVFNNYQDYSGSTLFLGAVFFAFQIYGDFSGYSDIAIGTSRLFGFRLEQNFAFPYFSRDIAEFWRRWHISLSKWFRDYLYFPLGGSLGGMSSKIRNTFIIFLVSGFWHGANWTFIVWGFLNALYFIPLLLANKNRKNIEPINPKKYFPNLKELSQIVLTFFLTCIAWVFFRADNVSHALLYLKRMFLTNPLILPSNLPIISIVFIVLLLVLEWINRAHLHGLYLEEEKSNKYIRWSIYLCLVFLIIFFKGNQQAFIYFQF